MAGLRHIQVLRLQPRAIRAYLSQVVRLPHRHTHQSSSGVYHISNKVKF